MRTAVETQVLLIGEGADLDFLASHLEAAGYAVACTSAAEAMEVIGSLRPAEVMITPGVPLWQRTQLSAALVERYPDVRIVLLKKRGATPGVRMI